MTQGYIEHMHANQPGAHLAAAFLTSGAGARRHCGTDLPQPVLAPAEVSHRPLRRCLAVGG